MRLDKMVAKLHFYLFLTLHFIFKIFIRSNINNKPKTLSSYISVSNLVTFKQRSRNIIAKLALFFTKYRSRQEIERSTGDEVGVSFMPSGGPCL